MLRFEDHLGWAKLWSDFTLQWMETAAQCSTAILRGLDQNGTVFTPASTPQMPGTIANRPSLATSWYRQPQRSPFEPNWLGLGWVLPLTAPAMAPNDALGPFKPFEAWSKAMQLAAPSMTIGLPAHATSALHPMSWPAAAMPWMIGLGFAMVAPAPAAAAPSENAQFSAYRSESGHAVAQIVFPNQVVAAVAVPENTASLLDALFSWPRSIH
jgi:hypothetical protein